MTYEFCLVLLERGELTVKKVNLYRRAKCITEEQYSHLMEELAKRGITE